MTYYYSRLDLPITEEEAVHAAFKAACEANKNSPESPQ